MPNFHPYVSRADFQVRVPSSFHEGILRLCATLDTQSEPLFVEVRPEPGTTPNRCFHNVQSVVEKRGGEPQFGWLLWEAPKLLVEAEFHCVWKTTEQGLLCISARQDDERSLAFLPDHRRRFAGAPVGSVALSWPTDPVVSKMLELESSFQELKIAHFDITSGSSIYPAETDEWFTREIRIAINSVKEGGARG